MLSFGYGRWSKIRSLSLKSDKLLNNCSDREMRPYANWFLMSMYKIMEHHNATQIANHCDLKELKHIIYNIIKVSPDGSDHQLASDIPKHHWGETVDSRALFWIKRINLL